jgi:hypothetical protein
VRDNAETLSAEGRDYIDRTIATVRNHRDADNCWPQWANIFADEIEALRADRDRLRDRLNKAEKSLGEALTMLRHEHASAPEHQLEDDCTVCVFLASAAESTPREKGTT